MTTIADVARAAGVSISTVSYTLSGKRPVAPDTVRRVQAAIEELAYRPHAGARALASNRTQVLGLVAPLRPEVGVAVIMQFVSELALAAREHDHDLLLLTQAEGTVGLERVTSSAMVDGLILMDVGARDERIPMVARLRQPTVLIGLPDEPEGLSCVDLDFEHVGRTAVDHLTGLGHREIVLVGSPSRIYRRGINYALRLRDSARQAAAGRGARVTLVPCDHSPTGVADALDEMDARVPGATAVIVHNESVMPGLLEAIRGRGRRVPADLSVLAICPRSDVENLSAPVTSIDLPIGEVSRLALETLLDRIQRAALPEVRLCRPGLVDRGSTRPV